MREAEQRSAARWSWVVVTLLAASIEPIAVKLGYRAEATPYQTLLVRNSVAALAILPLARGLRRVPLGDATRLAGAGALLFSTAMLTLVALARLTVALVLAIVSLTPVAVTLVSRWRARERLGARFIAGVVCGVVGAALATGLIGATDRTVDAIGIACALGAVASSTIYRLALEYLTARHPPAVVSTWAFATSGLLALVLVAPFAGLPPAAAYWAGGWTGVAAAIANVGFVTVIRVLGAARASLLMLLQRPLLIGIAALLLGEKPGWDVMLGVALVLSGVWLGRQPRREAAKA